MRSSLNKMIPERSFQLSTARGAEMSMGGQWPDHIRQKELRPQTADFAHQRQTPALPSAQRSTLGQRLPTFWLFQLSVSLRKSDVSQTSHFREPLLWLPQASHLGLKPTCSLPPPLLHTKLSLGPSFPSPPLACSGPKASDFLATASSE